MFTKIYIIGWVIDFIDNTSLVILRLEVRESCSLYIPIFIFCAVVSSELYFCTRSQQIRIIFNFQEEHWQILPLQFRVDLGVMAMKGYLTFTSSPEMEYRHQIQFSEVVKGYSQCILSPTDGA